MKRDYQGAVRSIVCGLYNSTESDMREALENALEALSPEMATLFSDNEDAAFAAVNNDDNGPITDEDVEDEEEPLSEDGDF